MLIIDGSETVAKLFAETFETHAWRVAVCNDRDCAIERLFRNEPYDAILVSSRIPGTSGVQLIRLIRSLEQYRMTAILMVTGDGEISDEALAGGADEVLLKPINPLALVWAVEKHVS